MGDHRRQNDGVNHAFLALGIIVLLLILSIIIAWIIVCCERCRRRRKYRPGQLHRRPDPLGVGERIIRTGPSPEITRHHLIPSKSNRPSPQHLVIANKAFLSKSTPQLLVEDGGGDDAWRLEGMMTPVPPPSEALIPLAPRPVTSSFSTYSSSPYRKGKPQIVSSSSYKKSGVSANLPSTSQQGVLRSKSEPLLVDPETQRQGSFQDISIHDQIAAILGTFPDLDFTSFLTPTRRIAAFSPSSTSTSSSAIKPKRFLNEEDDDQGPESSVDDVLSVEITPRSTGTYGILRPTALTFRPSTSPIKKEEKRYDFAYIDVENERERDKKNKDKDKEFDDNEMCDSLLETTL